MIDRNCDATILAGASDARLASKVVEHARTTRTRLQIRRSDFDLGSLLHHDIPYLASRCGIPMTADESFENPHLSAGSSDRRSIVDASRHVMRSMAFSIAVPGNSLLEDPARGNVAALLIDRAAVRMGVDRIGPAGASDPLARHMLASAERLGLEAGAMWSPGWEARSSDRKPADHDVYARRMYMLDDRQLASELLEQVREMRERYRVEDAPTPVATMLWQTVPSMAALFGMPAADGEGRRFAEACRDFDDQRTFDLASGLVASAIGADLSGAGIPMTIGDRALFAEPASGNPAAFLLDRAAISIGADRGGPFDPIGLSIVKDGGHDRGHAWTPDRPAPSLPPAMMVALRIDDARSF